MRVVGVKKIEEFIKKHSDSKGWLKAWLAEARTAEWQSPNGIKNQYSSASILNNNKVAFDVKGNKYRMEIQVSYRNKVIAIKRLGTHAEYNRWIT